MIPRELVGLTAVVVGVGLEGGTGHVPWVTLKMADGSYVRLSESINECCGCAPNGWDLEQFPRGDYAGINEPPYE